MLDKIEVKRDATAITGSDFEILQAAGQVLLKEVRLGCLPAQSYFPCQYRDLSRSEVGKVVVYVKTY